MVIAERLKSVFPIMERGSFETYDARQEKMSYKAGLWFLGIAQAGPTIGAIAAVMDHLIEQKTGNPLGLEIIAGAGAGITTAETIFVRKKHKENMAKLTGRQISNSEL